VGGDVTTVNGAITLQQTEVGGKIDTVAGDITIGADSIIHGGVLVEKPSHSGWNFGWGKPRNPRIVIGPNAVVEGELRFEREVELYVHTTAKIGKVVGATVHTFTDTVPARD
jgi:CRISPR/Cas system CMR-associated protein Cmr3 (group 5 of RAMP superfamily)